MNRVLNLVRLPLFLVGLALLFAAERYFDSESYHMGLRAAAFVLMVLGLVASNMLAGEAKGRGFAAEAKGWRLAALWQAVVIGAVALYLGYRKSLGDAAVPDSASAKVLLGAWLVLLVVGLFAAIGIEWAMRDAGTGETAEPGRVARAGASMASIGMLFCFLVTLNYVGDKKDVTRDWSYLKVRTPSESTKAMLKTLTEDMTIALFYPPSNEVRTLLTDYFDQIAASEPKVKVEYYDKDMNPTKAEAHRVSRNGQIVFDYKGKKSRVDTGIQIAKARKTLKELDQEFQKAFLEISTDRKTLYFTRGHGENSWVGDSGDSPLRSLKLLEGFLRSQNYSTRLLGAAEGSATAIPDDASAVVVAGPTEPLMPEEVEALRRYVAGGGNLFVFLDIQGPTGEPTLTGTSQPLLSLLDEMGLGFKAAPLANEKNHIAATRSDADRWFVLSNVFTSHESVVSLSRHDERVAVFVYQGGSLLVTPEKGRWKAFETVRSLSDTFVDENRNYRLDGTEKKDSYVMGAVAELKDKGAAPDDKKNVKMGRVAVFADATIISDAVVRNLGNALYFADTLKWLVGESETAGEIATEEDVKIRHTSREDDVWFFGSVVFVPLLVLGAGYLATRRKRTPPEGPQNKGQGHAA